MSLTAALGVASLAGNIFGAVKGAQANKANQNLLNKEREENEAFYNNRVNQDFLETNAAKGIFEKLRKNLKDANKQAENTKEVTGGTAESEIASKSANQENYNDAVNNLAQNATSYQTRQEGIYRGEKSRLNNEERRLNENKAQNAANLAGNAGNLMGTAASMEGFNNVTPIDNRGVWGRIYDYRGQNLQSKPFGKN